MDAPKVPAPADGAARMVPVPAEFRDVLESAATALIGSRAVDFSAGAVDAPRHVADLLVRELKQALDARREVIAAAERPDGAMRLDVIELIGPEAINCEHRRVADMWEEGSNDYLALAQYTDRLSGLERLVLLAGASR